MNIFLLKINTYIHILHIISDYIQIDTRERELKYKVSIKSLQFQKFITEANGKTDKWKLLQNKTYIFKFFFLPYVMYVCYGDRYSVR